MKSHLSNLHKNELVPEIASEPKGSDYFTQMLA